MASTTSGTTSPPFYQQGRPCTQCESWKPYSNFNKTKKTKSGFQSKCNTCKSTNYRYSRALNPEFYLARSRKWASENLEKAKKSKRDSLERNRHRYKVTPEVAKRKSLWTLYRMTLEEFLALSEHQNSCCLICEKPSETLCVDHCHTSGTVRGLLCSLCNTGLGLLKEDRKILTNAVRYLEKWA